MTLIEILQKEGRQIEEEFLLSSKQGEGTSQEIADFRENAVQDFLQRYYPTNHIVSKGKITDLDGTQSNSIDCLLLNPEHPNLIDSRGKFRLIFSDGCDCAIEVKPNLVRTDEIHRALKQGISVKNLKRSRSSILLKKKYPIHILEFSKKIPFYIFCIQAFETNKLIETIKKYYIEHNISHENQIDGIIILGKGIIKNLIFKELNLYNSAPSPIKENTGWYFVFYNLKLTHLYNLKLTHLIKKIKLKIDHPEVII